MRLLRIALAQVNTTVGDLDGNAALVLKGLEAAREAQADLVVFPELTITGYPPEDLLLRPQFITDNLAVLHRIVRKVKGIAAVIGFVDRRDDIFNAAAFASNGRIVAAQHKSHLPNYGVFDENRYFQAGTRSVTVVLNGITIGFNICEDIWFPEGPTRAQSLVGDAEVVVNISASPYHRGKLRFREEMLATRAVDNLVAVASVNQFEKMVLGLSGGIDSALSAVLAVDALGARDVVGVFMPSPYSSDESREDAKALAQNLGIRFLTVPITPIFQAYTAVLVPVFKGRQPDVTEENLQARIRGNLLMSLSNKYGWLVLTTGNKSEMSVGYATLYGDM